MATSDDNNGDRNFPHWNNLYNADEEQVRNLPWYNKELDDDLAEELNKRGIIEGRLLDLGTGPATQALVLHKLGNFEITATDISKNAIERARKKFLSENTNSSRIKFMVDDILNSKLESAVFDYIFDRGCFHVIAPSDRERYVFQVNRILSDCGILFLKTFSKSEPREEGPYKFSPEDIRAIFGKNFVVEISKETVYQGTLKVLPKALFSVLRKRNKQRMDNG